MTSTPTPTPSSSGAPPPTGGTSSAPATSPTADAPALDARTLKIAAVVVLGAIMSILDTTVVAVAQNEFQRVFSTTAANTAWTATGYTLALAAVIPLSSWASARFGTKRVYLVSLVLFVLGSILCAFAWNIGSLVAFRMLQGAGGGMLMPVGMMILTRAAGPERVGSIMAVLGIPMLLGPIMGPILGGVLIEYASWHWVFLINVPIGIGAFIYAAWILEDDEEKSKPPFDFIGLLLLSPGLAVFLFGVSSSNEEGTFVATKVLVPMVVGAVLIVAFVVHALRGKTPLLDLRLFKNGTLSVTVVTFSFFLIAFFGAALLFPQYFIGVRGESTLMAGLLVAPQGLGAMITMPIAGRMTDKIGPGKFVLAGIVLIGIGMGVFVFLGAGTSYWLLCGALFVQGLGMGMSMMPMMSAALATLKPQSVADGSTLVNVVQQTAASIGTAVISVILASKLKGVLPPNPDGLAGAFGDTFIVAVVLIAVCLVPAFFLPRKKIANTAPAGADGESAPVMMH